MRSAQLCKLRMWKVLGADVAVLTSNSGISNSGQSRPVFHVAGNFDPFARDVMQMAPGGKSHLELKRPAAPVMGVAAGRFGSLLGLA